MLNSASIDLLKSDLCLFFTFYYVCVVGVESSGLVGKWAQQEDEVTSRLHHNSLCKNGTNFSHNYIFYSFPIFIATERLVFNNCDQNLFDILCFDIPTTIIVLIFLDLSGFLQRLKLNSINMNMYK